MPVPAGDKPANLFFYLSPPARFLRLTRRGRGTTQVTCGVESECECLGVLVRGLWRNDATRAHLAGSFWWPADENAWNTGATPANLEPF